MRKLAILLLVFINLFIIPVQSYAADQIPYYDSAFPDYYSFVKDKLFDGQLPYVSSSNVPGTTTSAGDLATYATNLANALQKGCPIGNTDPHWGYVYYYRNRGNDLDCLGALPSTFDSSVITILQNSTINNVVLQCVGFVMAVTKGVNTPLPGGMNAQDYNHAFAGYTWIPNTNGAAMIAGDIAVWRRASGNGHIAVIINNSDGSAPGKTRFSVVEANGGNGSVGHDAYARLDSATADQYGLILQGWLRITAENPTGGGATNIPPSTDTCQGKLPTDLPFSSYAYYLGILPKHQNFGDPKCDFTLSGLTTAINTYETNSERQKCYYFIIARYESDYNANAYLAASTSGLGAYGLFQMNPGSAGRQSTYDVGDVYWGLQTQNAIKHNQLSGNDYSYWDPRTLAHDTQGWCHP